MRRIFLASTAALALVATMAAAVSPADAQWRRHYRGGGGGGALIGGLAAGALIGGAIAANRGYGYGYGPGYYGGGPYYAPAPVYAAPPVDDEVAYCSQRYKSYDPASGTFLGYDGLRHPCP